MKKEDLKIGMSFDVIAITAEKPTYRSVVKKGDTGVVRAIHGNRDVTAYIGITCSDMGRGAWYVPKKDFKVVGRLRITKIK